MAFKLTQTPSYKAAITVHTPNEHGKFDQSDFVAEFKRPDVPTLNDLRDLKPKELVERVLIGWTGLVDDDGKDVPYNPANRDALLLIPQALMATFNGFWDSIFKAREKN